MACMQSKKGILNMVDLAGSERISIDHDSKTTKEAQASFDLLP